MIFETPNYSCWYSYKDSVYEPSEDSFIFLDGLADEITNNKLSSQNNFGQIAMELGSGSGIVSTSFSKWTNIPIISIDINQNATACTDRMMEENNCKIHNVALSRSGGGFRDNCFDFVLINPPYVVTTSTELYESQKSLDLEAAWSGGEDGTELLYSQLLPAAIRLINNNGVIYLVAIKENKLKIFYINILDVNQMKIKQIMS